MRTGVVMGHPLYFPAVESRTTLPSRAWVRLLHAPHSTMAEPKAALDYPTQVVVVVVVVVFTLSHSFYPTASAVHRVSVLSLRPGEIPGTNYVAIDL